MRSIGLVMLLSSALCSAQEWTQLPDFPGTARDDATAFTIADRIYVGTGREVGFGYTNDWFCYDPADESWSAISAMPASGRQYCTTFTIADTGYVFGGTGSEGANNELWAYHPGTDEWVQKASLPAEARFACVATEHYDQSAFLATGMLASGVPTNESWRYLSPSDTWVEAVPVPGPARHRAACIEYANGPVILGGADSAFTPLRDAWYSPGNTQWYAFDSLPAPRWGADGSGTTVAVIACGATEQVVFHKEVWQAFGEYEPFPDFPGGARRGGVGAGVEAPGPAWWSGQFYYGLGLDATFARRNDWWRLDLVVGIEEHEPISSFALFPVPSVSDLTVQLHPKANGALIIIHSIDGQVVSERNVDATTLSINTTNYANGVYLLTLRTASGDSTQRFVVQH